MKSVTWAIASYKLLLQHPTEPKRLHIAKILDANEQDMLNEWGFIQRLPIPPSPGNAAMPAIQAILIDLATSHDRRVMFPIFSSAVGKILLLPVCTAGVERRFSTMNRILSSTRWWLTPEHVKYLMLLSIEGPEIPDIRDGNDAQHELYSLLMQDAVAEWMKKNTPGLTTLWVTFVALFCIISSNATFQI